MDAVGAAYLALPEQLQTRLAEATPTQRLLVGIAFQALFDLRSPNPVIRDDAALFFVRRDPLPGDGEQCYSFRHICDVLGLDQGAVCQTLHLTASGFARDAEPLERMRVRRYA